MSTIELPDDVAAALAAAAEQSGTTVAGLVSEMIADRQPDALEAFLGCSASGRFEPMDIHAERAQVAVAHSAENI